MDCEAAVIPKGLIRTVILGIFLPSVYVFDLEYISTSFILMIIAFLSTSNRPYWIYIITTTFFRDIRLLVFVLKIIQTLRRFINLNMTVPKIFSKLVQQHPQKTIFYTEDKQWTFQELFDYSNKIGHMLKDFGVKKGDAVGIMFGDGGGVRHPAFWLGSSYLGAPAVLIPPHLKSIPLIHTIKAAKVTFLIYTHHLLDVIKEIQDDPVMEHVMLLQYNINVNSQMLKNAKCVSSKLNVMPITPITDVVNDSSCSDHFLYIYTSGTTGLPKAAIITHMRYMLASTTGHKLLNMNENDVLYNPLPLHHTSGCVIGIGQGIIFGSSVAIRNKFSVSQFWTDCIKYKCTVALYIGEICRFLLNAAEKSEKIDSIGQHRIRAMIGNGLRSTLWKPLQETFNIPYIYEIYASSEGNSNMVNLTSKEGAVGFLPRFLSYFLPMKLIKCDRMTGEPFRDQNGYCTECKPCEAGLLIGKINPKNKVNSFAGYLDKDSTKKKLLQNVFKSGDVYFNSGDILVMDDFGYFYFRDRTGDTFRWRGENVSTTEVENVVKKVIGLDINVYGVSIPNVEGKAGMAAIENVDENLDMKNLLIDLKKILPRYAIPIFIRIVPNTTMTITFKLLKTDIQKEAFNVNYVKDKVYFLDDTLGYVPLTVDLYEDIINGKIRF